MSAQRTKVDYVNRALALLGEAEINELTADESNTSAICTQLYDPIKESLLQRHGWSFALRTVTLSRLTSTPPEPWSYEYNLPADCLRVWTTDCPNEAWAMAVDPSSDIRRLYSNRTSTLLIYIHDAAETLFPPLFQRALTFALAAELAMPITMKGELANYYREQAEQAFSAAAAADWSESPAPQLGDNGDFFNTRFT